MINNILICGDSFSSDWKIKYPDSGPGWPIMIADNYNVTNIAMAGSSIIRTLWQLESKNIYDYDAIIITHTSPNRIYVREHPVHKDDLLHANADLMHTDIKYHAQNKPELKCIVNYFEQYYDLDYAIYIYNMIEEKIEKLLSKYNGKIIHMTNLPRDGLYKFDQMIDFSKLMGKKYRGLMNHYNLKTNTMVYNQVQLLLEG